MTFQLLATTGTVTEKAGQSADFLNQFVGDFQECRVSTSPNRCAASLSFPGGSPFTKGFTLVEEAGHDQL